MLSLVLIVKNEEKNLARCLESVEGLWDELVIVDTGSTDKTVEIAEQYTDKIFHFEWVDDFAKARNFSFGKCTQPWIMWLDADDVLKPHDVKSIRTQFEEYCNNPNIDFMMIEYNYWVDPPTMDGIAKAIQTRERIIRNGAGEWKGMVHEHIVVNWSRTAWITDAAVWHLRDAEDMTNDSNRNIIYRYR